MDKTFALITEGITDYLVLNELLYNFLGDDIEINQIQPLKDETDKQTSDGGWENVINYLLNEDLNELLLYNDYIIIQLDSDIVENEPISISLNNRKDNNLYLDVENRLKEFISNNSYNINIANREKFLFAIGVHSIECWLLAIVDKNNKKKKVKVLNCLQALNRTISKNKKYKTISNDKGQSKKTYIKITNSIRKKRDIIKISKKNIGFEKFIEQLEQLEEL